MRYIIIPILLCFLSVEPGAAQNDTKPDKPVSKIAKAQLSESYVDVSSTSLSSLFSRSELRQSIEHAYISENEWTTSQPSLLKMNQEEVNTYANIGEFIQGRIAGVVVTKNPASPYGYDIVIRGKNSLNANNNALVVLNGIAVPSFNLNSLDPSYVKSIDVLKGPDATMYGSRGANGVLVINTK